MVTPLDPVIAQVLPILPLIEPPNLTPESARDMLRGLVARSNIPPPSVESVEEIKLDGPVAPLPARVYRASRDRSATVVFFHGGGWVAGDLDTHDRQARQLAIETGAVVVSLDYRRAPEVRFPGAFDDSFAALREVLERVAQFGGDDRRVAVAGDSAGGNLAAAIAIACRDAGIKLAAQLLIYPATNLAGSFADPHENERFPSRAENADGYFLTMPAMKWYCEHYLGDTKLGLDWRASPLRAKSLAGVAPAVVGTAWFDPLRDEGQAYADALQAAGVETKRHRGEGMIHGYFGMGDAIPAAKLEVQRVCADFKAMLERG